MRRTAAILTLALALTACSDDTSTTTPPSTATTQPATVEDTSTVDERDAWKVFELAAPSFTGASDAERTRFASETCDIIAANDGLISTSVEEVNQEFGVPGTTKAGLLVMFSTRWHCPEYLVDAGIWAERVGMIEAKP